MDGGRSVHRLDTHMTLGRLAAFAFPRRIHNALYQQIRRGSRRCQQYDANQ
jgi:hypothetical protein